MDEHKSSQERTKEVLKTNAPIGNVDLEPTVIPEDRKIIKSGEIVFETKNVAETEKFLKSAVKEFDAFRKSENKSVSTERLAKISEKLNLKVRKA